MCGVIGICVRRRNIRVVESIIGIEHPVGILSPVVCRILLHKCSVIVDFNFIVCCQFKVCDHFVRCSCAGKFRRASEARFQYRSLPGVRGIIRFAPCCVCRAFLRPGRTVAFVCLALAYFIGHFRYGHVR